MKISEATPNEATQAAMREADLMAEVARLRAALEVCAKATWFDDHDLEFHLTKEAEVARAALNAYQQKAEGKE